MLYFCVVEFKGDFQTEISVKFLFGGKGGVRGVGGWGLQHYETASESYFPLPSILDSIFFV